MVESKAFTYTDEETDSIVLMEPNTFVQLDVPKHLFGDSIAYLKDEITVYVELFNDRPMSSSVPKLVTCTVVEAQVQMKGMGATPHNKKLLLDNGLRVEGLSAFFMASSVSLQNHYSQDMFLLPKKIALIVE